MIAPLLCFVLNFLNPSDGIEIRTAFFKASASSKANDNFKKLLDGYNATDPVITGYRGMYEMFCAYHSYNPVIKYYSFHKGKQLLESAIKKAPQNPELRFLRYSVQSNAPGFLLYNENKKEDRDLLQQALKDEKIDADLRYRISKFLSEEKKK